VKLTTESILAFLKAHKQEFQEKYAVEKIGLFGSYAKNEAHENSDIDILVKMPSSFDAYYDFKEYLEASFDRKVDLGLEKSIRGFVANEIQKDIIYV
jgi:predicted nucleotidyltransferase